jgi:DNA polymerase-3 subunit alpha
MINLRVFSNFSIGESILKPSDIVDLAVHNNQKIVGIINRMNMFCALEFSILAIKKKIKPVIGCLLKVRNYGYIPIYLKNNDGYVNISKLLTSFYKESKEFIEIEDLIKIPDIQKNIIVFWGGEESEFINNEDLKMKISFLNEIFQDNFYIEIQKVPYKTTLLNLAITLHIPIIATHNTYFAKGNFEAYYTFHCIFTGERFNEEDLKNHSKKNGYFYTNEELLEDAFYEEAIENNRKVGERCNCILESKPPMIPEYVKEGSNNLLRKIVIEKLIVRLIKIPKEKHYIYYERIEKELKVLIEKGFANYFLVTYDFINKSRELNIPVGPGRGSATGSLVSYSLNITNVDPIKFNLIFERFLNPERVSLPDIDIDFCQEKRDLIIQYLIKKYTLENVAHIITFGTLKSRIVLRDVGRVLGIPLKIVDNICKFVPQDQVNPLTLKQASEIDTKLMEMFKQTPQTEKLLKISIELEGCVRHLSTHAAGVVIFQNKQKPEETISNYLPLYKVDGENILSTQGSMKYVELSGLVKFDFLGLQTLTLIRKICELIEMNSGVKINIDEVPEDDEKTFKFICSLNLAGVFQLDSFGMKSVIYDLQPDCLENIIAIISLYRPGPMKFIPKYIENKKDITKIEYLVKDLEPILKTTYGIIVYQEQVLEIAVKIAKYTLGEADNLRRAMGKKNLQEMAFQESKFLAGAKENNISEKIAKELFNRMSDFAGYGFNKCHAAPYALISYWTAYLKAHYPLEFMSVIMTLDDNDTNKLIVYFNDMKNLGIKLLSPCVQKSQENFSIEKKGEESVIRFGLKSIKNMGSNFATHIVEERKKNGLYTTLDNFLHRNINFLNKRQLEFLIYSGALDSLQKNKSLLIENLLSLTKGETLVDKTVTLEEDPYWEMEAIGFFLTKHPMDQENFHKLKIHTIKEIMDLKEDKGNVKIGGVVYDLLKKKTHYNNKTYMFVKLIDISGMFEITIFNDVLEKYIHLIYKKALLVIDVQFEKKQNIIKIIGYKVAVFDEYKKNFLQLIRIYLKSYEFIILKNILDKNYHKNGFYKMIIVYKKKEYLLNFLVDIHEELLVELKKKNIFYKIS